MFKLLKIQHFKMHNVIKIYYNPTPNTVMIRPLPEQICPAGNNQEPTHPSSNSKERLVGLHGVGYSFRNAEISETGRCAICLLLVIFLALGSERMEMSIASSRYLLCSSKALESLISAGQPHATRQPNLHVPRWRSPDGEEVPSGQAASHLHLTAAVAMRKHLRTHFHVHNEFLCVRLLSAFRDEHQGMPLWGQTPSRPGRSPGCPGQL